MHEKTAQTSDPGEFDQQRSGNLAQSAIKIDSRIVYISFLVPAFEIFSMVICTWLEVDIPRRSELIDKVEGMAQFFSKIIKHIGVSSITEHLAMIRVLTRGALCVLRGVQSKILPI
jgi:hypothetical protein